MKRILLLVLVASLLCACAPKQPKTMEQQADEARAEAYKKADEKTASDKEQNSEKPNAERKTSLGDILTIISY